MGVVVVIMQACDSTRFRLFGVEAVRRLVCAHGLFAMLNSSMYYFTIEGKCGDIECGNIGLSPIEREYPKLQVTVEPDSIMLPQCSTRALPAL